MQKKIVETGGRDGETTFSGREMMEWIYSGCILEIGVMIVTIDLIKQMTYVSVIISCENLIMTLFFF